ncbi:MAG: GNAT family N-acetyltransferase [Oscillospiraceae bacterium]|nr:GNAT family N-acetyltransferase [Oscillospiraceae bacterium]
MKLEMRCAREDDDLQPLWEIAFLPDEVFFTRDYRPERALIYTDGETPVSMLHMLPQTLLLGDWVLQAGYIMGVATNPAYRKRGLAGDLISAAIRVIERQGFDCAMLIPASAALALYYRRFGLTLRGTMPIAGKPVPPDYRSASIDDIPALSAFYDKAFPNRAERGAFEWETILLGYAVTIGSDGYTVEDEGRRMEQIPVPSDTPDCERMVCLKPFTAQAEKLLTEHRPYVNLLYT